MDKKIVSTKKTLGTVGAMVFFLACGYAVFRDPQLVQVVLWPLAALIAGLFGIKSFSGVLLKREETKNGG